jgi:hypothetical protein
MVGVICCVDCDRYPDRFCYVCRSGNSLDYCCDASGSEKLAARVSTPRVHPVRVSGCLAPHSKQRAVITPTPRQQGVEEEAHPLSSRWGWAKLLKRVLAFDTDPSSTVSGVTSSLSLTPRPSHWPAWSQDVSPGSLPPFRVGTRFLGPQPGRGGCTRLRPNACTIWSFNRRLSWLKWIPPF